LTEVARGCTTDFISDPTGKYWTLYDISWSIVAAFIQCHATGENVEEYNFGTLATDIANLAMQEARKMLHYTKEWVPLLVDIIEVLSPILAANVGGDRPPWKDAYEIILVT
jgi:hypothetical protein